MKTFIKGPKEIVPLNLAKTIVPSEIIGADGEDLGVCNAMDDIYHRLNCGDTSNVFVQSLCNAVKYIGGSLDCEYLDKTTDEDECKKDSDCDDDEYCDDGKCRYDDSISGATISDFMKLRL